MRPLAQRDPYGILLIRVATTVVPFVQFECNMRLQSLRNERHQKDKITDRIIKLWNTAVDNWKTRQQNEIDQSMDMTFFREVYSQRTFAAIPRRFQIRNDVSQ